ncbi:MAG: exodeoxyribonuclease VII large subunit [Nitrospinae bacterium]|nr:exodeoxyribonuclease VII large subunit [Nitrospinota bacterium]
MPLLDDEEGGRQVYTVAELTSELKDVIEGGFSSVWVEGEISNFKLYPSGHAYFTLKDEEAQVRAVMWKGLRNLLKFEPQDGDHVVCRGRLTVYEKRGEYQLSVEAMEPKGIGALQAAFEKLKEKLAAEGLFDLARKKPLPYIPWTVGIVTSPSGAVLRDMVRTINRRFPGLRIVFKPVAVQGEGAAQQIAAGIAEMNEYAKVDVIIAGRGGGSLEDLWAFNEEVVARAIAASRIPVVSAVGHETDFTIADFVADVRASTPTAAAEIIAPARVDVEEGVEEYVRRMSMELRDRMERGAMTVDDMGARLARAGRQTAGKLKDNLTAALRHLRALSPSAQLAHRRERVFNLDRRLVYGLTRVKEKKSAENESFMVRLASASPRMRVESLRETLGRQEDRLDEKLGAFMKSARNRFSMAAGKLDAVSPLKVLGRGYSIVTSPDGRKIIKSAASVKPGDGVKIRFADGETQAVIKRGGAPKQENLF